MSQITVAIPFALPPAELAGDLIRVLKTPSLATLLSRHKRLQNNLSFTESRVLPHEIWLAEQLGCATEHGVGLAGAALHGSGLQQPAGAGYWFIVQPSHLQLARTHLLLGDSRYLSLSDAEARALYDSARPSFEQLGGPLLYAGPQLWFWRADAWAGLDTASPDAAVTQNVSDWMPEGEAARACRRLQNEVQMAWHEHPVNVGREARGAAVINACWLWGGTQVNSTAPAGIALAGGPDWLQALTQPEWRHTTAAQLLDAPRPLLLPQLIAAAQAGEWSQWLDQLHEIEQHWLAPLLQGLRTGRIDTLTLMLSDRERALTVTCTRLSLRAFWRKISMNTFLTQG